MVTKEDLANAILELKESNLRLEKAQEKTDEQMKETHERMKETDERMKETHERMKETDEQMKRTDLRLDKIAKLVGNVSNNQGYIAEEFFYNCLSSNPSLNGINYDFTDKNASRKRDGIEDEFDILMVNGKDIAIIETKYKAHSTDIEKLITKKLDNFKRLYPEYKDYTHHLALASFYINNDVKKEAKKNNVLLLQRKGELIETV